MADERHAGRLLDRLSDPDEVAPRPLFGGRGRYRGRTIFGIAFWGRLDLKVDAEAKSDFLARGMGPFRPDERQALKSYFEVPPDVLADPEALRLWAGEAIRAGMDMKRPSR